MAKISPVVRNYIAFAEALAKLYGGLPIYSWRKKRGLNNLNSMIQRHKKAFSHINKKQLLRRKPEEWVPIARELEKEYAGLPPPGWIQNNMVGLYKAMYRHPDLFIGIKYKKQMPKALLRWVPCAEALEKIYGAIPSPIWLRRSCNKLTGLERAINAYPEEFSHIKQFKLKRTLVEQVALADELMEAFDGVLPSDRSLRDMGHGGLEQSMRINPDAYLHIVQDFRGGVTLEQNVEIAKQLEKEHGVVPRCSWLIPNGFNGLYQSVLINPKAYSGIEFEDESLFKTVDDHVDDANRLAGENGGLLPSVSEMKRSGYGQLYRTMTRNKERFAHLVHDRSDAGFDPRKAAFLYVMLFNNGFIKVGITNFFDQRYAQLNNQKIDGMMHGISDWFYYYFDHGIDAAWLEDKILREFKPEQFLGLLGTKFDGRSELLNESVHGAVTEFIKKLVTFS